MSEVTAAPPPPPDPEVAAGRPSRRRGWLVGAVMAAAAAGMVVSIGPYRLFDSGDEASRGSGPLPITVVKPAPNVPFDRTFAWKPIEGTTSYRVAVFIGDGTRTFEVRDLTVPGVKLADNLAMPAGEYFVQVTAMRNADVIGESPMTPFTIR